MFDRNKKIIILLIWVVPLLLWMQYGTMNLTEFVLMHRIYRFLTVITLPIALTIGYFMAESKINKKRIFNIINIIIICVLVISSFISISKTNFYMNQSTIDYKEIADYLEDYPGIDIYADYDSRGKLDFLLGYERTNNLKNLELVENPNQIKDAFVIVNASRGFVENEEARASLPEFIYNPPADWEKRKVITAAYLEAYGRYDPVIYYVPP
jgi:hypothetical protein